MGLCYFHPKAALRFLHFAAFRPTFRLAPTSKGASAVKRRNEPRYYTCQSVSCSNGFGSSSVQNLDDRK
jgi:hypothetical protein